MYTVKAVCIEYLEAKRGIRSSPLDPPAYGPEVTNPSCTSPCSVLDVLESLSELTMKTLEVMKVRQPPGIEPSTAKTSWLF